MCSRSVTKVLVLSLLLGATLGGCSDIYFDRRDTISLASGEAMAANRATMIIDPWPVASGRNNIAYNGEKAAVAAERYRTGRVIPPVNATTSVYLDVSDTAKLAAAAARVVPGVTKAHASATRRAAARRMPSPVAGRMRYAR